VKDRFIRLATQQAYQSTMPNRLGAVVVNKKTVLGAGYNRKDHPLLYTGKVPILHPNMGMHAEIAALYYIDYKSLNDSILYVVRLRRNHSIALSKPCSSCQWYIKTSGIKRVIYSLDDGSFNLMRIR